MGAAEVGGGGNMGLTLYFRAGNACLIDGDIPCTMKILYKVEIKGFYLLFPYESYTSMNVNKKVQ